MNIRGLCTRLCIDVEIALENPVRAVGQRLEDWHTQLGINGEDALETPVHIKETGNRKNGCRIFAIELWSTYEICFSRNG